MTIYAAAEPTRSARTGNDEVPKIALRGVGRTFGEVAAVDDIDLEINEGEFVILLGPSGCGKSTLLRMIAGLQPLSSGSIEIDGREAQDMEPSERDLAFVFQNYALYPHMSVRRNMSFPLLMSQFRWWHHLPGFGWRYRRRLERSPEVAERIAEIAEILDLTPLLGRIPATLSGGQRQRVALGRAMVRDPLAFLMDEPLSNLDAKLRAETRSQLIRFHQLLAATIIYVTHDQVEAMTMGDKIGVMREGRLQQFGTARDVYEHPVNTFVAQFIGTPAMNILPAKVTANGRWDVAGQQIEAAHPRAERATRATSDAGGFLLGVRSEWVDIASEPDESALTGTVVGIEDWGAEQLIRAELSVDADTSSFIEASTATAALDVRASSRERVRLGDSLRLRISARECCLFDAATEEAIG